MNLQNITSNIIRQNWNLYNNIPQYIIEIVYNNWYNNNIDFNINNTFIHEIKNFIFNNDHFFKFKESDINIRKHIHLFAYKLGLYSCTKKKYVYIIKPDKWLWEFSILKQKVLIKTINIKKKQKQKQLKNIQINNLCKCKQNLYSFKCIDSMCYICCENSDCTKHIKQYQYEFIKDIYIDKYTKIHKLIHNDEDFLYLIKDKDEDKDKDEESEIEGEDYRICSLCNINTIHYESFQCETCTIIYCYDCKFDFRNEDKCQTKHCSYCRSGNCLNNQSKDGQYCEECFIPDIEDECSICNTQDDLNTWSCDRCDIKYCYDCEDINTKLTKCFSNNCYYCKNGNCYNVNVIEAYCCNCKNNNDDISSEYESDSDYYGECDS
jgi:hypothetical protein